MRKAARKAAPARKTPSSPPQPPAAKVGIALFIAAECMFFAGLISAYLVFRISVTVWPPPDQPRLPVEMTALNTFFLLLSAFTFHRALRSLRDSARGPFMGLLTATAALGALFLGIQGYEWIQLVRYGLTAHANIFGGFFYALVGMHGLHVAGGLTALLYVWSRARKGAYSAKDTLGVEVCRTYWFFVAGLWPILFGLIYF